MASIYVLIVNRKGGRKLQVLLVISAWPTDFIPRFAPRPVRGIRKRQAVLS